MRTPNGLPVYRAAATIEARLARVLGQTARDPSACLKRMRAEFGAIRVSDHALLGDR